MSIVCFSFIMDEEKGFVDILMELEKEHIGPLLEAIPTMYGHPSIKNIKDFVCLFTNLVVKLKYIGTRDIVSIMTISHKLVFFKDLSEQFKYTIMIKATHPHCLKLYLKLNVLICLFSSTVILNILSWSLHLPHYRISKTVVSYHGAMLPKPSNCRSAC